MLDLFEYYERFNKRDKDTWREEWLYELIRRKKSEPTLGEKFELEMMRREKELGVRWICYKCNAVYYVKTYFDELYCSRCLFILVSKRLLPSGKDGRKNKKEATNGDFSE